MRKFLCAISLSLFFLSSWAQAAPAVPENITLFFEDRLLNLNFQLQPDLITQQVQHFLEIGGQRIAIDTQNQLLSTDLDLIKTTTEFFPQISAAKLHEFFEQTGVIKDLEESTVEIRFKNEDIVFDGFPNFGYEMDFETLVGMINGGLITGEQNIRVPSQKIYSEVIAHPELQKRGVREILAIGESNFKHSSPARIQNILAGAEKFNGHILRKGKMFSFNEILEDVEEEDGFVRELVIKGNTTEKELGGGVCQVSTTAFRAAFHSGLPIKRRRNHSYAVPYYQPVGLDAAIYLGQLDLRFSNDTPGDILIQTVVENDNLYFIFYGTRDGRQVISEGPFISHYKKAPEPKVYYTEDIPSGEMEYLSHAYDGFESKWIRNVIKDGQSNRVAFSSTYRPWPAKILKGKN